jgi:hypothetical protein
MRFWVFAVASALFSTTVSSGQIKLPSIQRRDSETFNICVQDCQKTFTRRVQDPGEGDEIKKLTPTVRRHISIPLFVFLVLFPPARFTGSRLQLTDLTGTKQIWHHCFWEVCLWHLEAEEAYDEEPDAESCVEW